MNMPNNLTYKELSELIASMPPERMDDNVSVLVLGDCFPISQFGKVEEIGSDIDISGVLDEGHFVLKI
jgi:hypothetical protein